MSSEPSGPANATHAEAEAIIQLCRAYAVPIILRQGTGRPQVVGSGVSFQKQDRQFVITAAHVVDLMAPGVSLVIFPNLPQPSYPEPLRVIGKYKHPYSDIAVIELADPLAQSDCDEHHCVRMADLSQHPDVHQLTFFVHGFPTDSQQISPLMPRILQCTLVAVPTNYREMRDGHYGDRYRGPTIIMEYGPENWERYDMAYYSGFADKRRAFGLSGGGVWYVQMKRGELLVPRDTAKLVGIQSHWVEDKYLMVVPITEALDLIDRDIIG